MNIRVVEILSRYYPTTTKEEEVSMSTQAVQSDKLLTYPTQSELKKEGGAEPVAIIGIGCRFPGANGPSAFWKMLCNGVDVIT